MKRIPLMFFSLLLSAVARGADALPNDEAGVTAWFESRGARVTRDADGHCVKLFHNGKPELSVEELALIGKLDHLQELALNSALAGDGDWGFMKQLPELKTVRIWHGHHFSKLDSFAGIAAEDFLIGGCMGLRDLNKDDPKALRDAVLTLHGMPNLKKLSLYHSPLTPDDSHLAHLVKEFPNLTELRIDFAAPRGQEIHITPDVLRGLANLKLTRFAIENSESLTSEHFGALADIETLENLHIYPPREGEFDYEPLLAKFKAKRPEVQVTFQPKIN